MSTKDGSDKDWSRLLKDLIDYKVPAPEDNADELFRSVEEVDVSNSKTDDHACKRIDPTCRQTELNGYAVRLRWANRCQPSSDAGRIGKRL